MEYLNMRPEHVAQVAELEKLCFSAPWSENAVRGELTNPLSLWIVAVDGDTVAGYIGSQSVMGEADMMNVAVSPSYRRQGIAEKLVVSLVEKLTAQNVSSLTLEVRASNEPAIALYEKLSFVQVGRRPNYYTKPREDALILRKEWHCENSGN
jgi:ribosomal-protein-alanine N-acetyltransferase